MDDDECDFDTLAAMLDTDTDTTSATQQTTTRAGDVEPEADEDDDMSDGELDMLANMVQDEGPITNNAAPTTSKQPHDSRSSSGSKVVNKEEAATVEDELHSLYARIAQLEAEKKKAGRSSQSPPSRETHSEPSSQSVEKAVPNRTYQSSKKATPPQKSSPNSRKHITGLLKEAEGDLFASETNTAPVKPSSSQRIPHTKQSPSNKTPNTNALAGGNHGDSDSDWEDLEGEKTSRLSDAGRELHTLLQSRAPDGTRQRTAHAPSANNTKTTPRAEATIKKAQSSQPAPQARHGGMGQMTQKSKVEEGNIETESFSRIRIINPKVSSLTLKSMMTGRKFISVSNFQKKHRTSELDCDWATIGVIVSKTETRKSCKGNNYLTWRLSSLVNCEEPQLQCFLFGGAFKQHWKNTVGTVVGVLNPVPMNNKEGHSSSSSEGVAVMVDVEQKVLVLGQSKDFALCRAKTKAGNNCSNFVNQQKGDYCVYHVQSAFKKQSAKRAELQAGFSGVTPKSFEKKLFPKSSMTVSYAGQTFTAGGPAARNQGSKSASISLQGLQQHYQQGGGGAKQGLSSLALQNLLPEKSGHGDSQRKTTTATGKTGQSKEFLDKLCAPTPGSMHFVKHLQLKEQGKTEVSKSKKPTVQSVSASQFFKEHEQQLKKRLQEKKQKQGLASSDSRVSPQAGPGDISNTPMLGRGFAPGQDVMLTLDSPRLKPSAIRAKQAAIFKLKQLGGIEKLDPNAIKKPKNEETVAKVAQRATETKRSLDSQESSDASQPPKKKSRLLGDLQLESGDIQKLLKAKSKHDNELTQEEAEREEEYFEALEKQENTEAAMADISKLKCKAVYCKKCKYRALGASQLCRDENHPLQYYNAVKRFFACKDCGKHTVSLERYPRQSCSKCGGSSFKQASMLRERSGPKLPSEKLLLRGEETPYLGSLK